MGTPEVFVQLLENANDNELTTITRIWAAAFKDDAFVWASIGGDSSLFNRFLYSTLLAISRAGKIYVATYGDDPAIIGALGWFPPGRSLLDRHLGGGVSSPDQGIGGFDDFFMDIPTKVLRWFKDDLLLKYEKMTADCLGNGVKTNSYHIQMLGVHPDYWRRRVGKSLISAVECEAHCRLIVLECSMENVSFYKGCGFVVAVGPIDFPNSTRPFAMWVMTKGENC